jgi:hypothetical protein
VTLVRILGLSGTGILALEDAQYSVQLRQRVQELWESLQLDDVWARTDQAWAKLAELVDPADLTPLIDEDLADYYSDGGLDPLPPDGEPNEEWRKLAHVLLARSAGHWFVKVAQDLARCE